MNYTDNILQWEWASSPSPPTVPVLSSRHWYLKSRRPTRYLRSSCQALVLSSAWEGPIHLFTRVILHTLLSQHRFVVLDSLVSQGRSNGISAGHWQVTLDGLSANGKQAISNIECIIDTGTTLVIGDPMCDSSLTLFQYDLIAETIFPLPEMLQCFTQMCRAQRSRPLC